MVNQNAPHHLRGNAKEVRPVLPLDLTLINQPDERFIHQCRGLQRVSGTLFPHVPMGHAPKFVIHKRHQLVAGGLIPVAPLFEQLGYLMWRGCHRERECEPEIAYK
jgi:hypothetical protein